MFFEIFEFNHRCLKNWRVEESIQMNSHRMVINGKPINKTEYDVGGGSPLLLEKFSVDIKSSMI